MRMGIKSIVAAVTTQHNTASVRFSPRVKIIFCFITLLKLEIIGKVPLGTGIKVVVPYSCVRIHETQTLRVYAGGNNQFKDR